MNPGEWLDLKCRKLAVPETDPEWQEVSDALGDVERCIEGSGVLRIAQRYRCGSFEKKTMLPGRKEADLVIVLPEPPTNQTLDVLRQVLDSGLPLAHPAKELFKAVQMEFTNGVKVDVLPVAKQGVTPPGTSVPQKLMIALNGLEHVRWFERHAHGTVIHNAVRALKYFRDLHLAQWGSLSSFAVEVLSVDLLEAHKDRGLYWCFRQVLDQLGQGWLLDGRRLPDPARPENDLLAGLDEDDRRRIADESRRAVKWVDQEQWSEVFPSKRQPPRVDTSLGGKTLA